MKLSDKHYYGFLVLLFGIELGVVSQFFYHTPNVVDRYTALVISGLLVYLSGLTFWGKRDHLLSKTYSPVFYTSYVLLLIHSISITYSYPIVILHSVNLLLGATALVRFTSWKNKKVYRVVYILALSTISILGIVFYWRNEMINIETFTATRDAQIFILLGTIQMIAIHILSNVGVLKKDVNSTLKLNSRVQFQNDLISIISHNIRTPLSHIYTKLEIEKMRRKGSDDKLITELSESVQHLVNIVETTLNNRDIISHANESKPINELLSKLDQLYGKKIHLSQNGVEVQHEVENYTPVLFGLQNFIDNAIKWSEDKPSVFIKIKEETMFAIIADRGPGMSLEQLKVYGNPVISNGPRSGKGLGIYFTIGLITTLGLDILVKTAENRGVIIMVFDNQTNNYNSYMERGWVYKYFPAFAKDEAIIEDLTDSNVPLRQMAKVANTFSR